MRFLRFFLFLLFLFAIVSQANPVFASHKSFSDNFNHNLEGSFPLGWKLENDPDRNACRATWKVKDGMVGINITNQFSCTTNIVPSDESWNSLGNSYSFDLDMKFVRGTDHNVAFRFTPSTPTNNWYGLHFQSPKDFVLERIGDGAYSAFVRKDYPNDKTYHIKIVVLESRISVFIDNVLVRDYRSNVDRFPEGKIALRAGTGGDPNSETYFDNIVVTHIDEEVSLNVPLFKQHVNPWHPLEYDHASLWSPNNKAIRNWGCAMTSAAMVLKYHGYNKLPDGTALDPGSLNAWLKNESDGYVGNGLVNWLAISRLSRLATNINNISAFDALEYSRIGSADKSKLTEDIKAGQPDILEQPGHFIVAKGIEGSTFLINDPFYTRFTLQDGYNNTFLSLGRYSPSKTNLSYIMVVASQSSTLTIKDSLGNVVGESYLQQPIQDPGAQIPSTLPPVRIYSIAKPSSESFTIEISDNSPNHEYQLQTFAYDSLGNVAKFSFSGIADPENPAKFLLTFDKNDVTKIKQTKNVSFQSTIGDINLQRKASLIVTDKLQKKLISVINAAQAETKKKKGKVDKKLDDFIKELNKNRGKELKEEAYKILLFDAQDLKRQY